MRFGFCTNFATNFSPEINYQMLEDVKAAGYDYVELPVMQIASIDDAEFNKLKSTLQRLHLDCDAACNLFPKHIRLTGSNADRECIQTYFSAAMDRCQQLGIKKFIFGSAPARNLDGNTSEEEGYAQIVSLCLEVLLPVMEERDMKILIEPIGTDSANFVNTLSDGMRIVNQVSHPQITLLADTKHMVHNGESPAEIHRYASHIDHIHIAEVDQSLPLYSYSCELSRILETVRKTGYDKTMSFETSPYDNATDIKEALSQLKRRMGL